MGFFSKVAKSFVGGCLFIAEAATGTYVINKVRSFFGGGVANEDEIGIGTWLGMGVAAVAAVPTVLTMLYYGFKRHEEESDHASESTETSSHPEMESQPKQLQTELHEEEEGCGHKILDFLIIGGTFGLLAYGGIYPLLKLFLTEGVAIAISFLAALVSAWGNSKLHGFHAHAKEGACELWGQLPDNSLAKAIYFVIGVIFGHLAEGFLAANAFLGAVGGQISKGWKLAIAVAAGIVLTGYEGNTEIRSTLLTFAKGDQHHTGRGTQILLAMPSFFHGLLPTVGAIELTQFIYNFVTEKTLAAELSWPWKVTLLAISTGILLGPNAKGFHSATLPACDRALKNLGSAMAGCKASWFSSRPERAHLLEAPVNSEPQQLRLA